jgi:hypothetical protein
MWIGGTARSLAGATVPDADGRKSDSSPVLSVIEGEDTYVPRRDDQNETGTRCSTGNLAELGDRTVCGRRSLFESIR